MWQNTCTNSIGQDFPLDSVKIEQVGHIGMHLI